MPGAPMPSPPAGPWQGFNHVALATPDLDRTLAFYRDVLGMRVVFEAPANPHHGRHATVSPGGPGLGLHFFEVPGAEVFTDAGGELPETLQFVRGALQHLSLTVADEAAGLAARDARAAHGVVTTRVMDQGPVRIFGFLDPSGMPPEAAWFRAGAAAS